MPARRLVVLCCCWRPAWNLMALLAVLAAHHIHLLGRAVLTAQALHRRQHLRRRLHHAGSPRGHRSQPSSQLYQTRLVWFRVLLLPQRSLTATAEPARLDGEHHSLVHRHRMLPSRMLVQLLVHSLVAAGLKWRCIHQSRLLLQPGHSLAEVGLKWRSLPAQAGTQRHWQSNHVGKYQVADGTPAEQRPEVPEARCCPLLRSKHHSPLCSHMLHQCLWKPLRKLQ
mmetsp:Transcript_33489/g.76503  ORF Transcript_33489/g.76503 Transcript_33489/m.76503 type:complete len:225 (-) Transcript_33489:568-1242(-)